MRFSREDGFTFNEILVAMNIIVVAVMTYSLGSVQLIRRQVINDNSTVAIHLAHDKIEELQARRPATDVDVCPGGGDHGLSPKGGMAGIFERCWKIVNSPLAADLKQAEVIVSWRDHESHEVRLATLIFVGE
jgi:Type II secretory pathway, pseudopilin PulG